jgi:3-hydroxyacyl-[acyl-carrier-protein] dehydratase
MSEVSLIEIQEIMRMLPHRYPFLLVDRILDYTNNEGLHALKNVTINEPFFTGHFPEEPVMPGVLIIEGLAQAGGLLAVLSDDSKEKGGDLFYFTGIDKAKFRRKVVPGDQLIYDVVITRRKGSFIKIAAKAFVTDHLVAQAELTAVFA